MNINSYNNFHDYNIININYDNYNSNMDIKIKQKSEVVCLKLINIEKLSMREINNWDFIYKTTIENDNKYNIKFYVNEDEIMLNIICEEIVIE